MQGVNEYIEEKQTDLLSRIQKAYEDEAITESFYNYAKSHRCDGTEWDAVFNHFTQINEDLVDQLQNKERYFLIERIEKGAAYIERTDITEAQRGFGLKLYNKLCEELEVMK